MEDKITINKNLYFKSVILLPINKQEIINIFVSNQMIKHSILEYQ